MGFAPNSSRSMLRMNFSRGFPALQHDVSDETVADDHVDMLGEDLEPLYRAQRVDDAVDPLEEVVRLGDEGVALAVLVL